MRQVNSRKKSSKGYIIFSIILSILLFVVSLFTIYQIYTVNVLSTSLTIMVSIIFVLVDAILALLLIFNAKRILSRIFLSFLTIVITVAFGIGGFYILQANSLLDTITSNEGKVRNTVSVIVMNDSSYDKLKDIDGEDVGTLKSIDTNGTKKSLEDISSQNVTVNTTKFSSIQNEVAALYSGEVDAIVLNEIYRSSVTEIDDYKDFSSKTRVLYTTEFYAEKTENVAKSVDNITSQPFSVLISGSDSRGSLSEVARSDVNMVVTVNPTTGLILLTSIPRDYYVTTVCDATYGCQNGAMDKLTHTGIHGIETTQSTIENLLGIEINYTLRVNFSSVVGLVDALGGIDVTVDPGYAVSSFYTNHDYGVTEGVNHLNGEAALAYSRERYAYQEGDRQRVKNQQQVLMAIIEKAISPSMLVNYTSFMQALSGSFETNMSQNEIKTLVQYQLSDNPSWTFIQYSLDGTGSTEMCAELGDAAYVMIPDQNTVEIGKEKINAVLNGDSVEKINSLEIDSSQTE